MEPQPPGTHRPERSLMRRVLRGRGALVFLAIGVIVYLAAARFITERADLPDVGRRTLLILSLALVVEMIAKAAFGGIFQAATRTAGLRLSFRDALRAALVASGVARLIPAGGAFTPAAMAWTVRNRVPGTAGAALRTTVLTYGGLLLGTGAAILWVRAEGLGVALEVSVVTIGAAGVVGGLLLLSGPRWMGTLSRRLPQRLRRLIEPSAVDRHISLAEALLLVLRLAAEAGSMIIALDAFGIHLSFARGFVAYGVAHLIGGLPGSPGGLGVIEAGLVGVLVILGVPASVSLGPVLIYRVIAYWIPAAIGVFAGAHAWLEETPPVKPPRGE